MRTMLSLRCIYACVGLQNASDFPSNSAQCVRVVRDVTRAECRGGVCCSSDNASSTRCLAWAAPVAAE